MFQVWQYILNVQKVLKKRLTFKAKGKVNQFGCSKIKTISMMKSHRARGVVVAQGLGDMAGFLRDPGSIHSSHIGAHSYLQLQFQGIHPMLSYGFCVYYMHVIYIQECKPPYT